MQVILDLCLVPLGVGVSVSQYVAECHRVLQETGLKQLHAYGTNIEGEWDAVTVKLCHERVHEMGAPRITIKLGTRTDREQTMADKVQSVERSCSRMGGAGRVNRGCLQGKREGALVTSPRFHQFARPCQAQAPQYRRSGLIGAASASTLSGWQSPGCARIHLKNDPFPLAGGDEQFRAAFRASKQVHGFMLLGGSWCRAASSRKFERHVFHPRPPTADTCPVAAG